MIIVQIHRDGAMDEIEVEEVTDISLQSLSKSQGEGHIRALYDWTYGSSVVSCFGWYDGEAGFENKHELPPSGHSKFLEEDSSTILLFGDIFLCLSEQNKGTGENKDKTDHKKDFDISMCGEFYHKILGGFDECDSLDSEEEDEHSSDLEFIDDDDDDDEEDEEEEGEDEEEAVETDDDISEADEEEEDLDYDETVLEEDDCLYENVVEV